MKKPFILLFTTVMFMLFFNINVTNAQTPKNQVTKQEVEDLIEEKLGDGTPLTQEQLTKALLDSKDEKINNLEGNISTLINTAAWFVGGIAILFGILTAIIGWLLNRSINSKLTKIEEKETNINKIKGEIDKKHTLVEGYHTSIKDFADDISKLKKKLTVNTDLLEKRNEEYESLRKYVGAIEDLTNSASLSYKFMSEHSKVPHLIKETRAIINKPQKHPKHVLLKLAEKLGENAQINTLEELQNHLDELIDSLQEEESYFLEKIQKSKKVDELYMDQAQDEDSSFYETLESYYEDWKRVLSTIETIKEHCENHLELNPI